MRELILLAAAGALVFGRASVAAEQLNGVDDFDDNLLGEEDRFDVSLAGFSSGVQVVAGDAAWFDDFLVASRPVIHQQPQNQLVEVCEVATFSVTAEAGPLATYQWRHQGVELPGATSAELLVPEFEADRFGGYDVVVSNAAGTTVSAGATLELLEVVPRLTHAVEVGGLNVRWPMSACALSGAISQRRVFLGEGQWESVDPPYAEVGEHYEAVIPLTEESSFFRLFGPD